MNYADNNFQDWLGSQTLCLLPVALTKESPCGALRACHPDGSRHGNESQVFAQVTFVRGNREPGQTDVVVHNVEWFPIACRGQLNPQRIIPWPQSDVGYLQRY